jgi:nucleotide-binding universal stress UspA family protein
MSGFTKMLVCAARESGDAAADYAARLAARGGASLTLADVVETVPKGVLRQLPAGWEVPRLIREQKAAGLERAATAMRRRGVTPRTRLLAGEPTAALIAEVERGGYDLFVAGAPSGANINAGRATASRFVRQCPSAVLLVHAPRRRRLPRILVAVDATPMRSRDVDALSHRLVESALWATDLLKGELHVLSVWDSFGERQMRRAGLSPVDLSDYRATVRHGAVTELRRVLAPFSDQIPAGHWHLRKGDAREVIPSFARAQDIDLLVIGTAARSGLARLVIGNTAEAVLANMPCSMLTVPPAS